MMSRARILRYGFLIAFVMLSWAVNMNSDFKVMVETPAHVSVMDEPAFVGKPTMEARYAALRDKYSHVMGGEK